MDPTSAGFKGNGIKTLEKIPGLWQETADFKQVSKINGNCSS